MRSFRAIVPLVILVTSVASAQSPAAHITSGDQAYRKLDAAGALKHYEAALATDSNNVQALWKASAVSVALGEFDEVMQSPYYMKGEDYGRRAVESDSNNADAQFALAQALGRMALLLGVSERLGYAKEIYAHATKCLELNPKYAECHHVLGEWHAEVMRLSAPLRATAIAFGGPLLGKGNWADATRHMATAVRLQPTRTIHHLDLGRIYADQGDKAKAKVELTAAIKAPVQDFNDKNYKAKAQELLKAL